MIRENCREDEDYRLDGNPRQQSKRCPVKKAKLAWQTGAFRVGNGCERLTTVQVVEFLVIS